MKKEPKQTNKPATPLVLKMQEINLTGNITPPIWYKNIKRKTSRGEYAYLLAINILSDTVYWYKPTVVRDELTGHVVELKRKFDADKLQRGYNEIADFFGCSYAQAKAAVKFLCDMGLLTKETRTVTTKGGRKLGNVLFIAPVPEAIKKISSTLMVKSPLGSNKPTPQVEFDLSPKGEMNPSPQVEFDLTYTESTGTETSGTENSTSKHETTFRGPDDSFDNETEQQTDLDKNKEKKRKKVAPKKEKAPSRVHMGIELFDSRMADYLKARGIKGQTNPIDWNAKECGQLKALINKIEKRSAQADFIYTDDSDLIQTGLGAVLDAFILIARETGCKGTGWFTSSFKPSQMSGYLQEIKTEYNALKDGKSNGKTNSKEKPTAAFDQYCDDVIDRWRVA